MLSARVPVGPVGGVFAEGYSMKKNTNPGLCYDGGPLHHQQFT